MAVRPLSPRSIYFLFRTPTTSRTAAADARSIFFSSAVSRSFTISSTPFAPSFTGHAHVEAVDAVLALEVRGAREDALLVEADRVDHLRSSGARRVPGRGAEQPDELAAADLRPLDELRDPALRQQLGQRNATDVRRRDDGNHLVAMAAEDDRSNVFHGDVELLRDERREARGVENARHADDAVLLEARRRLCDVAHCVERVRDDDEDRVGRVLDRLLRHRGDDRLVRRHEVVPAHPRRARPAGRDHDDVGARGLLVAVRADHRRLVPEDGGGLVDVERLPLREVRDDVDEYDVRVIATRELLGAGRTDVPGADDRDLLSHLALQSFDDRVRVLGRPDRTRIVARRLEVVGHALAGRDDGRDGALEARGSISLTEVVEHELPGEDHRRRVHLVLPLVLGGGSVCGLEDGSVLADVRARRDPEAADEPGGEVADDVAVEVRQHQDVELLGPLDHKLVHGICINVDGKRYSHAWVEDLTHCWDRGIIDGRKVYYSMSKQRYYRERVVVDTTKYTIPEVADQNEKHGTYGPWLQKYLDLVKRTRSETPESLDRNPDRGETSGARVGSDGQQASG